MRSTDKFRNLCIWLSVILTMSFMLPAQADTRSGASAVTVAEETPQVETAKEMRLIIADHKAEQNSESIDETTSVSGLKITVDSGQKEYFDQNDRFCRAIGEDGELVGEITVTSKEGISWQIPVFWINEDFEIVRKGTPGEDCMPVLAFFVPDEYQVSDRAGLGFSVSLDTYLSGLYEAAGGAVCVYDPNTGITYILPEGMGAGLADAVRGTGKAPAVSVPGLPEELRKPSDGNYNNPASSGSEVEEDSSEGTSDRESASGESSTTGTSTEENTSEGASTEENTGEGDSTEGDSAGESTTEESTSEGASTEENTGEGDSAEGSTTEESTSEGTSTEDSSEKTTGDTSEASGEDEEDSLTGEQLLAHCSNTALDKYDEDELAAFVELIITSIQPQAVSLIRSKFPAFAEADENSELGEELGLYVYRMYGDRDGVAAHEAASAGSMAYVGYNITRDENKEAQLSYIMCINLYYFETTDEEGQRHIDTSEQAVADMDNTIVHEMLHAYMYDYNRTGSIGTNDPNDYFKSAAKLRKMKEIYKFPSWFEEGVASSVENIYQFRYENFQLLRYEGEGVIGEKYTAENLLKAYTTTSFVLEGNAVYEDVYDLEDTDGNISSTYVSGYLADLYLGELAAQYAGLGSSVTVDSEGNRTVSSETIRLGLNSILERMHNGESLDEVICSISGGSYQNTEDFEKKFIKGEDKLGDPDSVNFVVDYLNYMQEIASTSAKIPNGSILYDFTEDYTTPIDRTVTATESIYQITDSSDYVASTVTLQSPYTDGGKSKEEETVSNSAVSGIAAADGEESTEDEESVTEEAAAAKESATEESTADEENVTEETAAAEESATEENVTDEENVTEESTADEENGGDTLWTAGKDNEAEAYAPPVEAGEAENEAESDGVSAEADVPEDENVVERTEDTDEQGEAEEAEMTAEPVEETAEPAEEPTEQAEETVGLTEEASEQDKEAVEQEG